MPFKSKSQMRWMFENHPEMAKEWAAYTHNLKSLPEHVKNSKHTKARKAYGVMDAQQN